MWGTATSSFQIEGSNDKDGKIESIWDEFCDRPNTIKNTDNAKIACDHYNRFNQDFNFLDELGVNSYRFSISWPRIVKDDLKTKNQKGLDFYSKIIDNLLSRNIEPFLTLNHWDIPLIFHEKGGWENRDCIEYFLDYSSIVTKEFGDKVKYWITHNEPWVIANLGHNNGTHAPGSSNFYKSLEVSHNLLLSHGKAIPIIKSNSKQSSVGIVLNLSPGMPASKSSEDLKATKLFNQSFNEWYLCPLYGKNYPKEITLDWIQKGLINSIDFNKEGDLETISTQTDFLGINYYSRAIIRSEEIPEEENLPVEIAAGDKTDFEWEVYPDGLRDLLIDVDQKYNPGSIFVTENGCAYDYPKEDGTINDKRRVKYLDSHIMACKEAVEKGVCLDGYMHWSLLDNFEWAEGYSKKFGLVYVDFDTQERTPKQSFWAYKNLIKKNLK